MSLFALPVTLTDIEQLQLGIGFFTDPAAAASEVAAINANTPGGPTVYSYAVQLLASQISLAQVAMADSALMEGVTVAAGNVAAPATNTLALFTTQFLPPQIANALAHGYNPTVYAAESLGLALSSNAAFNTNYVSLSASAFVSSVAALTSLNANAISGWLANWTAFYTANPPAHLGLTVTQAAYGATFGDAVGTALLNPTPISPANQPLSLPSTTFNTIQNEVYNALKDNGEGQYAAGVAIGALPQETPLQGEANNVTKGVFLTQGIDSPTSGFTLNPNTETPLLNGFTATTAGQVFNALPFVTALGLANNTLNTGDDLETSGAAMGAATLNYTTTSFLTPANPPFATGVTMNGVNTLNITDNDAAIVSPAGFAGTITGLLVENNNNSVGDVTLGQTGEGLKTLLTNINISGNGSTGVDNHVNTVVLAGAGDATKTINIGLTGPLGATALDSAAILAISNDVGGGTAGSPNLTYGTWSITAANTAFLQLDQSVTTGALGTVTGEGGVGGATALTLAGAGEIALGQALQGDWQKLQKIDASATTGSVFLTGATSGVGSQARASTANFGWQFGSDFGLLDDTGTGTPEAFALTSVLLGAGLTFLDVSSASATQVAALTTAAGTGVTVNPGDEIIVKDSVATTLTATTFKNIAGFSALGIGGPAAADGAGGIVDLALLPPTINTIDYITAASSALTVNDQTAALTIDTFDNGGGFGITVGAKGPAPGFADSFTLIAGNTFHTGADHVGSVTVFGDELVTLSSVGTAAFVAAGDTNTIGTVDLTPTLGGNEMVTISGAANVSIGAGFGPTAGAIFDLNTGGGFNTNNMTITVTDTGVVTLAGDLTFTPPGDSTSLDFTTNAVGINASASGGLIMAFGDLNYTTSTTVTGSVGDNIIGSTTAGNVLGGSIGNDTFTADNNAANTIYTDGGADTVTLLAGHTAVNHIEFYAGEGGGLFTPGGVSVARDGSITQTTDVAQLGWWGLATGATEAGYTAGGSVYAGLADHTGTSADATTIANFTAHDVLDFGASTGTGHSAVWGSGGPNGLGGADTALGLVNGDFLGFSGAGNPAATVQALIGSLLPTAGVNEIAAGTNLIELTGQTFSGPSGVAAYLNNPATQLFFATTLPNGDSAHVLVAYADFSDGMTHIADLALANTTGAPLSFTSAFHDHVSDIAIVGTSLATTASTVHFA